MLWIPIAYFNCIRKIFQKIVLGARLAYVGTHVKMADGFGDGLFEVFEEKPSSEPIRRSDDNGAIRSDAQR